MSLSEEIFQTTVKSTTFPNNSSLVDIDQQIVYHDDTLLPFDLQVAYVFISCVTTLSSLTAIIGLSLQMFSTVASSQFCFQVLLVE